MIDFITTHVNTDPFLLFFGTFYIVLGLSCVFAKSHWEDFIELFVKYDAVSLFFGILVLPISLFIIFFYNNWESVGSIILMVLGYMGFVKAVSLLLWPKVLQGLMNKEFVKKWLWLDAISGVALGSAMLVL